MLRSFTIGASAIILSHISLLWSGPRKVVPSFNAFPARDETSRRLKPPDISPALAESKGYRVAVEDSQKPSNFAGHYRVSTDTCGVESIMVVIVDSTTGKVYPPWCLAWPYIRSEPFPFGLTYRVSSRLLIANGCRYSDEACGTYYYEMTEAGLRLIAHLSFATDLRAPWLERRPGEPVGK